MSKSYIVAYTNFPIYCGTFKTKLAVFDSYKMAINFYKRLMTDNKVFYVSQEVNENEERL